MADIDVVKKSSSSWLWILIALIAVALIIWFATRDGSAVQTGLLLDVLPGSAAVTGTFQG